MKKLPISRSRDIIVQNLDRELLIYNTHNNRAYCLNETAAIVFNACDGLTSFDDLKTRHNYTDNLIYLALDSLKSEDLLAKNAASAYESPLAGLNRREAVRRIGLATMTALPIISSLTAPRAAQAASRTAVCNSGSPAGTFVRATGNGGSDTLARDACLNNLNAKCCSGNANGSIGVCSGSPRDRSCMCSGTCT